MKKYNLLHYILLLATFANLILFIKTISDLNYQTLSSFFGILLFGFLFYKYRPAK